MDASTNKYRSVTLQHSAPPLVANRSIIPIIRQKSNVGLLVLQKIAVSDQSLIYTINYSISRSVVDTQMTDRNVDALAIQSCNMSSTYCRIPVDHIA